jgi:hypothetical protein
MTELNTLNLTLPIKQDLITKAKLVFLQNKFNTELKDKVDAALKKSNIVHFARFVLIGDDYLQVLTEFDGDFKEYTDFFAQELGAVFKELFTVVEGAETVDITDGNEFFEFIKAHNLSPIGDYIYTSYPNSTVKDIKEKLGLT